MNGRTGARRRPVAVAAPDGGEAATRVRSVTECGDALPDVAGITLPGIDDVCAVACDDGKLAVPRCTGSGSRWSLHRERDIPPRPGPGGRTGRPESTGQPVSGRRGGESMRDHRHDAHDAASAGRVLHARAAPEPSGFARMSRIPGS